MSPAQCWPFRLSIEVLGKPTWYTEAVKSIDLIEAPATIKTGVWWTLIDVHLTMDASKSGRACAVVVCTISGTSGVILTYPQSTQIIHVIRALAAVITYKMKRNGVTQIFEKSGNVIDTEFIQRQGYILWWNKLLRCAYAGFILIKRPANERRRYNVTSSRTGWTHKQNNPCTGVRCLFAAVISPVYIGLLLSLQVPSRFDILHRARQWYCDVLGQILKRLNKQNGLYCLYSILHRGPELSYWHKIILLTQKESKNHNNGMKEQLEIVYLPKFGDLYVKLKQIYFWYPVQFHTFWAFDRFSSSNIDRAIAVQSFYLFVALMTSSVM